MNILINCSTLKIGGGLQVAHSFLTQLKTQTSHSYTVVLSKQLAEQLDETTFPDNFKFVGYTIKLTPYSFLGRNKFLDNIVTTYKIDKVFTVFGPSYWKPKVYHLCGYAKPHYIYKTSPYLRNLSVKSKIKLKIKEIMHMFFFNMSDALVTENKDVSDKLQYRFPKKPIFTVTNYYNQIFENIEEWDRIKPLESYNGITLLTISSNYPHKNLNIIPKVIEYLKNTYPELLFRFIMTINEKDLGYLDEDVKRHIVFLGKVNINVCPHLYKQSDIMFLPTLLECFSASYAESMYMKVPIMTSDLNFARGLCGDSAIYFDPMSPQDIGDKIYNIANNSKLKERLTTKGSEQLKTFDNYKDRTRKYLNILENETNHTRP